jgi:LacI family transcriptional regulator
VVLADRLVEGLRVPSVVTNNENGAYQAARYLLNLGHRRILYMGGDTQLSTENSRLRGFRRAMEEVGAEVDPALVVEESFDSDSAYRRVRSILADGQWRGAKMFTAVFCVDDVIAFGVKAAVENLGLAVPADVSIVGFDDIAFAGYLGLTTVAQPAVEMGRNAMILLVDALEGRLEEEDYTMVLEPSLIIRATCGRPRTVGSSAG